MTSVQLAVYDLSRGMCFAMSEQILGQRLDGIWHTGIFAFGYEWFFGGGINCLPVGSFPIQNNIQISQTLDMGTTSKTLTELRQYIGSISSLYTNATYDLINNNCNHFSNAICNFLTGHGIPSHIVDLPSIVFSTPMGHMLRPMIENIQRNINQQNAGNVSLDPFGNLSSSFSQTSLVSTNDVRPHMKQELQHKFSLENKPLVSNDRSSVSVIGDKLIYLCGSDGVRGSLLTEEQKAIIHETVSVLSLENSPSPTKLSSNHLLLLLDLINFERKAQMSCYFLLRLAALIPELFINSSATVTTTLEKLTQKTALSPPATVLAICFLANLLSHSNGRHGLLSAGCFSLTLDALALGLQPLQPPETRVMTSALLYNVVLACCDETEGIIEFSDSLVQLLCLCLDGVSAEADAAMRSRRLSSAYRILQRYLEPARELVIALEYNTMLAAMQAEQQQGAEQSEVLAALLQSLQP